MLSEGQLWKYFIHNIFLQGTSKTIFGERKRSFKVTAGGIGVYMNITSLESVMLEWISWLYEPYTLLRGHLLYEIIRGLKKFVNMHVCSRRVIILNIVTFYRYIIFAEAIYFLMRVTVFGGFYTFPGLPANFNLEL